MSVSGQRRRTAQRVAVLLAVGVMIFAGTPASAREPVGEISSSVVTFAPAGAQWRALQDAALDALPGPRPHVDAQLATGNVLLADLTADQRQRLAARPEVAAVAVDAPVPSGSSAPDPAAGDPGSATLPPTSAPPAACTGTQDRPQLEPEALGTMKVRSDDPSVPTAASLGYDGSGVTVGVITTALDPSIADFRRPGGTSAVVEYRSYAAGGPDSLGADAEAFGDVSAIAAQGTVTHDLATIVDPGAVTLPGGHCWIRVVGVAPGVDVVASDVWDGNTLTVGGVTRAIDDAVTRRVDVLSESFGFGLVPDASLREAIVAANAAAMDAGVTVVVSSGDAGANSTISAPAADPRAIAVGASITGRLAAQTGAMGLTRFGDGSWPDRTAAVISSSGFTIGGGTLDLLAPGDSGWSVCSSAPRFTACPPPDGTGTSQDSVFAFGGTSQAAPFVAGVASLVIQAYRETHGGRRPLPDEVQRILTGTADDLGLSSDVQGSGLVDAHAAVLAARGLDSPDGRGAGDVDAARTLVADVAQRTLTGSGEQDLQVRVTNSGSAAVSLSALALTRDEPVGRETFPIEFDPTAPTFVDGTYTLPTAAVHQSFTVAPGAAQLNVQLAGVPVNQQISLQVDQVVILDPAGVPVAYASSNDGLQVQVPQPVAGQWTAVVQTLASFPFRGELAVERTERRAITDVRADAQILAGGASTTLRARVPMPTRPGDAAATLRIAHRLALPILQRVPVDLSSGTAAVSGTARPQNGRAGSPAQQSIWEFEVPAGRRSIDVDAELALPAYAAMTGVLIDPDGLVRSITGNSDAIGSTTTTSVISQTVADPAPGRWRYVLGFWDTLWSTPATRAGFAVSFALDRRPAAAVGLPRGESLTAGTTRTVTLTLDNPGPTPLTVAVDPRTAASIEIDLPVVGVGSSVTLPITDYTPETGNGALPRVVVPPFSTRLSVTARGSIPLLLAAIAPAGVPSALSDIGRAGGPAATTTDPTVVVPDAGRSPGPWSIWLMPPGPVTSPTPAGSAQIFARVQTAAFDSTVTDGAGRAFVTATGAAVGMSPTVVPPGRRFSVPVELPARGSPGDRTAGFLALVVPPQIGSAGDGVQPTDRSGDVLAVFPYDYTVVAAPDPSTTTSAPPDPSTTTPAPPDPSTTATATTVTVGTAAVVPVTLTPITEAVAALPGPFTTNPQRFDSAAASGTLPVTGVDVVPWLMSAVTLLVLGGALVVAARRRPRPRGRV